MPEVFGVSVDAETRCAHYHSEIDRIAIKFYCCGKYYPCYECHEAAGCGSPSVWPKEKFGEAAVLCGACGNELTVRQYLDSAHCCPVCAAAFNPGCSLHRNYYFAT